MECYHVSKLLYTITPIISARCGAYSTMSLRLAKSSGRPVNNQALWQDMKDSLGGMVVESEPLMAMDKIRELVQAPGETELALAG